MFDATIAAIATPLGQGGLAVVRLSGPQALAIADRSFVPSGARSLAPSAAPSHTIQYGHIVRRGVTVDEVLVSVLRAPRTFTREDTVEVSCHGGLLPAKLVLDTLLENGARSAEPGEFTRRAFLNGRIDLAQAEAVADLIHSRTELALAAANEQLAGKLSRRINQLRDEMMRTLAHVEAHIDFPEEDIAPDTRSQLTARLAGGVAFMDELLRTANEGRILRQGIRGAIIGRPNAGKSSLLNQLLGHDRAIVSPVPGTTRDTIEETANLRGLPVVFIDTAGLREARDDIEGEGIRRSRESLARAEFILHVLDASQRLTPADEIHFAEFADKKRILVLNKVDLPRRLKFAGMVAVHPEVLGGFGVRRQVAAFKRDDTSSSSPSQTCLTSPTTSGCTGFVGPCESAARDSSAPPDAVAAEDGAVPSSRAALAGVPQVEVSCATGQGMEALKDAIRALVWSGDIRAGMLEAMINSRHQEALARARAATERTLTVLRSGENLELVAAELRIAVNAVGEIVGQTTTEDLLDSIFSQFCLGK